MPELAREKEKRSLKFPALLSQRTMAKDGAWLFQLNVKKFPRETHFKYILAIPQTQNVPEGVYFLFLRRGSEIQGD